MKERRKGQKKGIEFEGGIKALGITLELLGAVGC